jgi:hypothetical protein
LQRKSRQKPVENIDEGEGTMPTRSNSIREPGRFARQIASNFDEGQFLSRLLTESNGNRTIGEALQDPGILAEVEHRKRREALIACHIDPGDPVEELTARELERLCHSLARATVAKRRRL